MNKTFGFLALLLLMFCSSSFADALYQANVGGYTAGVGFGVGLGVGVVGSTYGSGYSVPAANGYYSGTIGVPYEGSNYPYGSQCCGCPGCNNCSNGYATGCR